MVSYRKSLHQTPKLTHHKASGQGVVRLDGRDVYCGPYGTAECQARYLRAVTEWTESQRQPPESESDPQTSGPADITINELFVGYLAHADAYYVKNGRPTGEATNIRYAIKTLREKFGDLPARDFGPKKLKDVRDAMSKAKSGRKGQDTTCRNEVNRRVRIIVRAFKWAVGEELVPPSVHLALAAVPGIPKGRSDVRESEPVQAAPDADVGAILPYASRQVRAMIELQRLAGMRPGEVCTMRTMDIDTTGRTWWYDPARHKLEHHGLKRRIPLGPGAREILTPWLRPGEPEVYLFQPREAEAERLAKMRANRKSKVQPSQRNRRRSRPRKAPGEVYDNDSYRRAIGYAVAKLNRVRAMQGEPTIEPFSPNQIRHLAADRINHHFDPDTTRTVLGHRSVKTTEVYMSRDY